MVQCPTCGLEKTLACFAKHYAKAHGDRKSRSLYIELVLGGVTPTCKCGCGRETEFYGFVKGFGSYVKGHKDPSRRKPKLVEPNGEFVCPFEDCDASFTREAKLGYHIRNVHDVEPIDAFVAHHCDGITPLCACGKHDCQPLKWYGWKHGFAKFARGHNARIDSGFKNPDVIARCVEKRKETYARDGVWNSGLTKETDTRVADMAAKTSVTLQARHDNGDIPDWRANNPEKACAWAHKISETKKALYAAGDLVVWNEGLTKETDERLACAAIKIAARYDEPNAGRRVKVADLLARVAAHSQFELVSSPNDYRRRRVDRLVFKCLKCGNAQSKSLAMLEESPVCFVCNPQGSLGQLQIFDFVTSLGVSVISSDRTVIAPKELDVWVPSHNVAIEYHGLYWHSKPVLIDAMHYHERKMLACKEKGVALLQIFEDEWRDRRLIVEGMIRHRLGLQSYKFDARKLSVRRLELNEARAFFDANHLEGYARCKVSFGLCTTDGSIIAAISLRRPFHSRYANLFELARACCRVDANVRGWLGKLSAMARDFAREHEKVGVMTYVDTRVGSGGAYASAGWMLVDPDTGQRFWWTDFCNRYNRFMFNMKNQEQVAADAGFVPIYGCSNSRWELQV